MQHSLPRREVRAFLWTGKPARHFSFARCRLPCS